MSDSSRYEVRRVRFVSHARGETCMDELRSDYIYRWGAVLSKLPQSDRETPRAEVLATCREAITELSIISGSGLDIQVAREALDKLTEVLLNTVAEIESAPRDEPVSVTTIRNLVLTAGRFQTLLVASLSRCETFHVPMKGAYSPTALVADGEKLFPSSLSQKVPAAVEDVRQAAQCMAFGVHTASAFHALRATETVLAVYFAQVGGVLAPPRPATMGTYLSLLRNNNIGDQSLRDALQSLKDLHRNPIAHPEHFIADFDELNALFNNIHSVIYNALKAIN